ncbi:hypothetical protein TWF694_000212 [Orbilia ellipsospora]|uniref:Uncharacterized protein n=1 Tax=Orbilia ellipsospora TaxID=2528407 RepID=A0AAV9XND8_9PEZI
MHKENTTRSTLTNLEPKVHGGTDRCLDFENENKPRLNDNIIRKIDYRDEKFLESFERGENASVTSHDPVKDKNRDLQVIRMAKPKENTKAFQVNRCETKKALKPEFVIPYRRDSTSSTSSFGSIEAAVDEAVIASKKKPKHTKATVIKNQSNNRFTKKIVLKPALAVEIEQRKFQILELEKGHAETNALIIQLEERCALSENTIADLSKDINLVLNRLDELEANNRMLECELVSPSAASNLKAKKNECPAYWHQLKLFVLVFIMTTFGIWICILFKGHRGELDLVEKYNKHLNEIQTTRPDARKFLRERLDYDL